MSSVWLITHVASSKGSTSLKRSLQRDMHMDACSLSLGYESVIRGLPPAAEQERTYLTSESGEALWCCCDSITKGPSPTLALYLLINEPMNQPINESALINEPIGTVRLRWEPPPSRFLSPMKRGEKNKACVRTDQCCGSEARLKYSVWVPRLLCAALSSHATLVSLHSLENKECMQHNGEKKQDLILSFSGQNDTAFSE